MGIGEIKLNPTQEIIIYFNIKIFMIYVKKYANIIWDISKTTFKQHKLSQPSKIGKGRKLCSTHQPKSQLFPLKDPSNNSFQKLTDLPSLTLQMIFLAKSSQTAHIPLQSCFLVSAYSPWEKLQIHNHIYYESCLPK